MKKSQRSLKMHLIAFNLENRKIGIHMYINVHLIVILELK